MVHPMCCGRCCEQQLRQVCICIEAYTLERMMRQVVETACASSLRNIMFLN